MMQTILPLVLGLTVQHMRSADKSQLAFNSVSYQHKFILHSSVQRLRQVEMAGLGHHMLSLEAQQSAYAWRGTAHLAIATLLASVVVLGIPFFAKYYWSDYIAYWGADSSPVAFFSVYCAVILKVQCT